MKRAGAIRAVAVFAATLAILIGAGQAWAEHDSIPFSEGEMLTYEARWGSIPVGQVVMEVLPSGGSQPKSGKAVYHFMMESRTSSGIDYLYRLRDVQHSYADLQQQRTLQYEKHSTGKKAQNLRIEFDWAKMKATCRNSGEAEKTLEILPGTLDPLALIYALRLKELKPGTTLEVPVTTGKGFNLVRGKVMDGGKITVEGRIFNSVVVIPDTDSMKGLMKKQPPMKIWFSADPARIPLRLQSSHFFGTLDFELLSKAISLPSPGGSVNKENPSKLKGRSS